MDINEMLNIDLIDVNLRAETKEELFELVGKDLEVKGFVNKNYTEGIKKREKEFPTGLITKNLNIALPHSETEYVEKPFIYIVKLQNSSLAFNQMGDNQEMEVSDFFFLGIKDPSKQVQLLSYLMDLFSDDNFINDYKNTTEKEKIYELINTYKK